MKLWVNGKWAAYSRIAFRSGPTSANALMAGSRFFRLRTRSSCESLTNRVAVSLNVPTRVADETDRVLRHYVHYVLERELKSVEFMDLVRREADGPSTG